MKLRVYRAGAVRCAREAIAETDVVEYPDSEKVGYDIGDGTAEPPRSQYLRRGRVVDYWDGEG